jgi:hypothetical protein
MLPDAVELVQKLRDRARVSSGSQTTDRLAARVVVWVLESRHKSIAYRWIVAVNLHAEAECCPIADVGVPVARELDQRLDSEIVVDSRQAEHDAVPHLRVGMVPQTTQSRNAPRVAQMTERHTDAGQDLNTVLCRKAVKEQLRCRGGKGPPLKPDIRLSAQLSQDIDRQRPRGWIGTFDEVRGGPKRGVISSLVKRNNLIPALVTLGRQRQRPTEDRFRTFHRSDDAAAPLGLQAPQCPLPACPGEPVSSFPLRISQTFCQE